MSRKKVLMALGIVAVLLFSGCLNGVPGDGGDGGDGNHTAAIAVGLTAEDQQQIQASLNQSEQALLQRAQFGQLDQENQSRAEDLNRRLQNQQMEALNSSVDRVRERVEDSDTLEIEGRQDVGGQSLLLVSGSGSEILGLLETEGVTAIASQEQYEQIRRQQQQPLPGGG